MVHHVIAPRDAVGLALWRDSALCRLVEDIILKSPRGQTSLAFNIHFKASSVYHLAFARALCFFQRTLVSDKQTYPSGK